MAANKTIVLGPVAIPNVSNTTGADLFTPPTTTTTGAVSTPPNIGNCYFIIRHIRVGNQTATAAKVALWRAASGVDSVAKNCVFPGATSAGAVTQGVSVAGNSFVEWYGLLRLDAADADKFLRAASDTSGALTIECEAEVGIS